MLRRMALIAVTVAFAGLGQLPAQDAKDAAKKAPTDAVKVTVVSVKGVAHKRLTSDPNSKWEALKVGDVLSDMTLIRTGLRTKVVLDLSDRGRVMIRRASKIGIGEFSKMGNLVKARLGLKYGSMRAQLDSSRGPNDFRVALPVATLSIRGSGANMGFSDWGMGFCIIQHRGSAVTLNREKHLREGFCTDENLTNWNQLLRDLRHVKMGPTDNGQTGDENDSLADNGDGRGIFNFAGGMDGMTLNTPGSDEYRNGFQYDHPGGFPGPDGLSNGFPKGFPNGNGSP